MPKAKKRPSKAAKAAQKILAESKLLSTKADAQAREGQEFSAVSSAAPINKTAMKPRPDKKRG